MELKYLWICPSLCWAQSFNRTFMELKYNAGADIAQGIKF